MAVNARRWTARHSSRFAAGGLLIVAATFLPGAESAADTQRTEVSLGYDCAFPLGTQPVTVRVAGEFPELGMVGRPVEPRAVSLEIGLPRPVLDDLADTEAASVSGLADLAAPAADRGALEGDVRQALKRRAVRSAASVEARLARKAPGSRK